MYMHSAGHMGCAVLVHTTEISRARIGPSSESRVKQSHQAQLVSALNNPEIRVEFRAFYCVRGRESATVRLNT